MHLSCIYSNKFAPEGQLRLQLTPALRASRVSGAAAAVLHLLLVAAFPGCAGVGDGGREMPRANKVRSGIWDLIELLIHDKWLFQLYKIKQKSTL